MITRDDELLTVAEAAALLRVSQPTIRRWVREGRIQCVRPGPRALRLRAGDVLRATRETEEASAIRAAAHESRSWTDADWEAWFAEVDELNERILARRGGVPLPNSVPIIREGRDAGYKEPR